MRIYISIVLISLFSTICNAQQLRPANSEKIYHELAGLQHLVNVLYIAAHPDDENTRLLAWLVNDQNIHTAYLSLTRGDGGQNILGSEQGDALGLIRTHELLEARKIDGAEQFFSRAIDFGFSKNYKETFKHWNSTTLTGDAVWVMRVFRPDIVICRFPPDSQAGHGQHAASAIIAANAFKLAGDKTKFPEQIQYYPEWLPKRIIFNAYRFGSFSTAKEDMFKLSVGQYLPDFGMGSGELSGVSRSVHKSQGAGTASIPGAQTEYFKLIDGEDFSSSLFDGIDKTWGRVNRKDIGEDIQQILNNYNFQHPDASIGALMQLRKKIASVTDSYWRKEKLNEIDKIIVDCTGFMAELFTKQAQTVAGVTLPFTLHVIARTTSTLVILKSINWTLQRNVSNVDTSLNLNIGKDSLYTFEHNITIPSSTPITQPYWLSGIHTGGLFQIPFDTLIGMPETPNQLQATLTIYIENEIFNINVPLSYKKLDPVRGDIVEQLRVVPDKSIDFSSNLIIANTDGSLKTSVRIHPFKPLENIGLMLLFNDKLLTTYSNLNIKTDTILNISLPAGTFPDAINSSSLSVMERASQFMSNQHLIQYSHIPTLQFFTPSSVKVIKNNWKCKAKKVGFIEGAGDYMPTFLQLCGLDVDILKESDFVDAANLKKYDAIITGIRAVNVEKRMLTWMPVLLKYAENGGTLIMQYNTLQDLATPQLGPYPITLSNQRVTEEDAEVKLLAPESKLFTYPNKISETDFKDWVQERGLYFATKWDDKYTPLFSMHDDGEQPLNGCTLYAKTGKGHYIYTTLSFSRQLPVGNNGAIRLLMNMLSIGK